MTRRTRNKKSRWNLTPSRSMSCLPLVCAAENEYAIEGLRASILVFHACITACWESALSEALRGKKIEVISYEPYS
jgi:hypothetical protein